MEKNWYTIVDGVTLGPYDFEELVHMNEFTPESLVWKDGFEGWVAANTLDEFKVYFKKKRELAEGIDEGPKQPEETVIESPEGAIVMTDAEPPYFYIWFVIALIMFGYLIYLLMYN